MEIDSLRPVCASARLRLALAPQPPAAVRLRTLQPRLVLPPEASPGDSPEVRKEHLFHAYRDAKGGQHQ